jgi:hypothetical protein
MDCKYAELSFPQLIFFEAGSHKSFKSKYSPPKREEEGENA